MKKGKGMIANETACEQPGARFKTIKLPNERRRICSDQHLSVGLLVFKSPTDCDQIKRNGKPNRKY